VCLTSYSGDSNDFIQTPLEELAQQIEAGTLRLQIGRVFRMEDIVEAHRTMEENKAGGKIVVLVD
jgi:NADPH:quinone reductase-like Zn-dependent oxidoreductase